MSVIYYPVDLNPARLDMFPDRLSDSEFVDLCARNPNSRLERKANGDITVMPLALTRTGARNSEIPGSLLIGRAPTEPAWFPTPAGVFSCPIQRLSRRMRPGHVRTGSRP